MPLPAPRAIVAAVTASLLVAACGNDPSDDTPDPVLHEFQSEGATFTVTRMAAPDGSDADGFGVERVFRIEAGDPMQALESHAGALTTLEAVLAFAPEGTVAHPDLVRAHAREAAALMRKDASVRHLRAAVPTARKAATPAATSCGNDFTNVVFPPRTEVEQTVSFTNLSSANEAWTCAGTPGQFGTTPFSRDNCSHFFSNRKILLGVCNPTVADGSIQFEYLRSQASGPVMSSGQKSLSPGNMSVQTYNPTSTHLRYAARGTKSSVVVSRFGFRTGLVVD